MRNSLLIFGAGGLGREVLSLVRASEYWEPIGFIDDSQRKGSVISGVPVLGGSAVLSEMKNISMVIAIGQPSVKEMIVNRLSHLAIHYPVLKHPSAIIQDVDSVKLGAGTVITAGTILTNDILVGEHTLINLNSTIGHDCKIGRFCSIMPGVNIAGEVTLGNNVLVGSGANILNRVRVGDRTTVGMGAVVVDEIQPDVTVVGIPARPIRSR